jgi:hypothetical protein
MMDGWMIGWIKEKRDRTKESKAKKRSINDVTKGGLGRICA